MDLRDIERKERWNRMIRDDEVKRNGWKSLLIGTITIAGLVGIIAGSMCTNHCRGTDYYARQDCIQRNYKALDHKVSPEVKKYIDRICSYYR